MTLTCCSTYSGEPSSTTSTARLPAQKFFTSSGHQRISDIEHIDRHPRGAVKIGEFETRQRPKKPIGQAAENNDADLANFAGDQLIELLLSDEFLRGGQALFDLQPLLA